MSVKMRQEVEQKIVGKFVDDALAAGYRLAVSLEHGYDVDECVIGSRDREEIMKEAFAGDECHIFVQPAEGPTLEDGKIIEDGWVYCVFGNSGFDVISDYSTNLKDLLKGADEIADHYGS